MGHPHSRSSPPAEGRPRYARAAAAARFFQVGKSTLWSWAASRPGFPPPLKIGPRTTVFDLDACERFLQAEAEKAAAA